MTKTKNPVRSKILVWTGLAIAAFAIGSALQHETIMLTKTNGQNEKKLPPKIKIINLKECFWQKSYIVGEGMVNLIAYRNGQGKNIMETSYYRDKRVTNPYYQHTDTLELPPITISAADGREYEIFFYKNLVQGMVCKAMTTETGQMSTKTVILNLNNGGTRANLEKAKAVIGNGGSLSQAQKENIGNFIGGLLGN